MLVRNDQKRVNGQESLKEMIHNCLGETQGIIWTLFPLRIRPGSSCSHPFLPQKTKKQNALPTDPRTNKPFLLRRLDAFKKQKNTKLIKSATGFTLCHTHSCLFCTLQCQVPSIRSSLKSVTTVKPPHPSSAGSDDDDVELRYIRRNSEYTGLGVSLLTDASSQTTARLSGGGGDSYSGGGVYDPRDGAGGGNGGMIGGGGGWR